MGEIAFVLALIISAPAFLLALAYLSDKFM